MKAFTGACIITSHDMAFVNGVASVVYHLANKRLTRLEGGVSEYKALVRETVAKQKRNRS
jgi:ATPase subunit of ABC transporter with duplicated ATPase domains